MPLYEYVCKRCSHPFEELSSANDVAPCPKCSATETERVPFSRVAIGKASAEAAPSPCWELLRPPWAGRLRKELIARRAQRTKCTFTEIRARTALPLASTPGVNLWRAAHLTASAPKP